MHRIDVLRDRAERKHWERCERKEILSVLRTANKRAANLTAAIRAMEIKICEQQRRIDQLHAALLEHCDNDQARRVSPTFFMGGLHESILGEKVGESVKRTPEDSLDTDYVGESDHEEQYPDTQELPGTDTQELQ